ncbi:MAG TPA: hypothetical protein VIJ72_01375, partial [Rhizomicrobium sp.]
AMGSLYGGDQSGASGALRLTPAIERDYDSGMVLDLKASILAAHDPLSDGRYGGEVFEKITGEVQTGLGRFIIGQGDGAAHALSVSGPKLDDDTSIDDPQTTFFHDPSSHRAFIDPFTLRSEVAASSNYAKLTYMSPTLFGLQLGASFTPSEGREVIPFLHEGPNVSDRQSAIYEAALRYADYFGPLGIKAYGGFSFGHDERKTLGHAGLTEWAAGVQADYDVNDDVKVSLGGAYHQSNAYAFDLNSVTAQGTTRALHASAQVSDGPWLAGVELGNGDADSGVAGPALGLHGYEASIGYVLNANLQITTGWQQLDYARGSGAFFNGAPRIRLDAGFLHLNFHV